MTPDPTDPSPRRDEVFPGQSELAGLMRACRWEETEFGPVACWPDSLKTAVGICLTSRFPMVIWWGPHQLMLYNDAWRPVLGRMKHPAIGRRGREVWPEIWHIIGPMLESVLATGQATWQDDQLLMLDRNGYLEETYFTYSYSPIHMDDGKIGGAFSAVSETTGRVLGERRLRALRDLGAQASLAKTEEEACAMVLRTLAVHEADVPFAMLYLLSADGDRLIRKGLTPMSGDPFWSPAMIRVHSNEDEDTWCLTQVVQRGRPILLQGLAQRHASLPSGPWPVAPDQALVLPLVAPGHERLAGIVVVGINPCRAIDGEYESFLQLLAGHLATTIANARAYEEEKRRAEALAELDRAKTVFFSNISHEFRTPLTLMLGPVENLLARSHTDLSPATKGQLEVVNRNGLRLLRLVNSLLDFSRIEAGRVQARYEPTDLAGFTAELASSFRSATERAGLDLAVICPSLEEPVYVDRDMWEKIVLNLLSNAFKFTFEGRITVAMAAKEGGVELCVGDTGVGIPSDHLTRIFERFHRVDNTRSRTHEGSGIGLALVQELVRLHGGTVRVHSVVGQGTSFSVVIPFGTGHLPADRIVTGRSTASTAIGAGPFVEEALRWLPETDPALDLGDIPGRDELLPVPCPPSVEVSGDERPFIVVADDNADMRQYVARLLSERYRVEAVADGAAALAAARTTRPDLILSDVMMPRLDGFGLLQELRSDDATRTIPVILLSARAGEESRIEGLEHGADDYLIKPFSARELLARVQSHLELARVRKDAQQEIARSKLFLERVADTMPDLLWVYDLLEGRNVYINRGVKQVLGYSVEDIQSQPGDLTDVIVHPDDLAATRDWYARLDAVDEGEVREIESRIRHADGSYRWIHSRATVFERTTEGHSKLILGISTDITQRKQADRERLSQMAQLRQQAEILNLAHVVIRDLEDRIIHWNAGAERLYGFDRAEAIGSVSHDLLHTVFPHPLDIIRRTLYRDGNWEGELIHWTKDGRALVVISHWILHRTETGDPLAILEVNTDATERKKAEHALRRLNDELEQRVEDRTRELVQSHDRLRALATELNLTEQRERDRLATELHDHLQQMLVLAKLKLGQGKAFAEAIPLCANAMKEVNEILSESLQYTRTLVAELSPPVLREHGLAAGLKWLGEYMKKHQMLVTVTGPEQRQAIGLPKNQAVLLFQSVRELLMNAHKYAGTGEATVSIAVQEGRLRIDVRDEGAGFDLSAAATSTNATASKFGLFSIRERMKALGGEFRLQSVRGKGTTATLILPLDTTQIQEEGGEHQESDPLLTERVPRRVATGEQGGGDRDVASPIRVLLVDDHLMVRQGLRTMLETFSDITVVGEAMDGTDALALVEQLRPRVVIMDINMPRMNGIEATAQISERYPSTIVIGLTVNAGEENRRSMLQAGAALLLTKEAAVEQLYSAIQETLRARNCSV